MKKQLQKIAKKAGLFSALIGVSTMYAQTTYTFTNASATGSVGPTAPQVAAAYLATNLNGLVGVVSGIQTWTVPSTGPYRIETRGAQGGSQTAGLLNVGGLGANMKGDFTLTAGTVLKIIVGQSGINNPTSPSGGGGSFVATNANIALIVSGGGGGAGIEYSAISARGTTVTSGNTGYNPTRTGPTNGEAPGGTSGNGGSGGRLTPGGGGFFTNGAISLSDGPTSRAGEGIAFVNGGFGGYSSQTQACSFPYGPAVGGFGGGAGAAYAAAGPGGGYSGGGGTDGCNPGTGGGGGSYNNGINQVNVAGVNAGMGLVLITSLYNVNISQTATISCNGNATAALSTTVTGGVAPYTYTWAPTGGNAPTASALAAGVYTCFVKDAGAVLTSSTFTVTQPTLLVSSVTSQTNITCNGGNDGAITVTVTGGTAPYSYTWTPSGGSAAMASGLVANTYTCSVKDANNCLTQPTATLTQPAGIMVVSNHSLICAGESANLTASGATSYTWNTTETTSVITVSPSVTTSYTVNASNAGCTYSATIIQNVSACTGINEVTSSLVSVYPNPNNGIVNISLTAALAQNSTLEIYDALGKLVVKQVLASELNSVNMSNLDNGIYLFKVLNNNNTVKVGKLIKQ